MLILSNFQSVLKIISVAIIDLVEMKATLYGNDLGTDVAVGDIPAEYVEQAEEYREKLIEAIVDFDEDLMEKYLGGEELTIHEIKTAIRKATLAVEFYPVVCGTAFKNKGVQLVLDAVVDYLPSPLDIPPMTGYESRYRRRRRASFQRRRAVLSTSV